MKFGKWLVENDTDVCKKIFQDIDTIKKITSIATTPQPIVRILAADSQGNLKPKTCEPAGFGIRFLELGARAAIDIPWSDIVDLVPRKFRRAEHSTATLTHN